MGSHTYQSQFFQLTPSKAAETEYDIVVVGGGFGGGTLAADLFDRNKRLGKKILVVESGYLIFHSHNSNSARPTRVGNTDNQNDEFFRSFRDTYRTDRSPDWEGGPLHTLGGRSTVWGIAIPRPHKETLERFFPAPVVNDLNNTFYEKAESTLYRSIPTDPEHVQSNLIHELNRTTKEAWEFAPTAAEFKQDRNFTFAACAYSAVDRLLEIAMNDQKAEGNFKILLGAKVNRLEFQGANWKSIKSVVLDGPGNIKIKTKHVVLCAGSVHSPAILLRSRVNIGFLGGGKLTDHDAYKVVKTYKYLDAPEGQQERQQEIGTMRLQAYTNLNTKNHVALARITVNSWTFASRSNPTNNPQPSFDMSFILTSKLENGNSIKLDEWNEPIIHITRSSDRDNGVKAAMATMTNNAMRTIENTLNVRFDDPQDVPPEFVSPLKLGSWAHELGSLPMPGIDPNRPSVLDTNLTLRGGYKGISVCDNSVFPYSPSANPSLTLAALALRLSAFLSRLG